MLHKTFLLGCFLVFVLSGAVQAMGSRAPAMTAGFKALTFLDEVKGQSCSAALWYPSHRAENEVNDADWIIQCARNGKIADGVFPLVIVSHGSAGSRHSLHDLAAMLAHNGCVVLCISHTGDNYRDADLAATPALVPVRTRQLERMLDLFLEMPEWREHIDVSRMAFVGLGTGAATVLALSGVPLNGHGYDAYCSENSGDGMYCSQWAQERMQGAESVFAAPLPVFKPRALLLITPGYGMLFESDSAKHITCPVMIFSAGMVYRYGGKGQAELVINALGGRAEHKVLSEFMEEDFLAKCPPSFDEPTAACGNPATPVREVREYDFLRDAVLFLTKALAS